MPVPKAALELITELCLKWQHFHCMPAENCLLQGIHLNVGKQGEKLGFWSSPYFALQHWICEKYSLFCINNTRQETQFLASGRRQTVERGHCRSVIFVLEAVRVKGVKRNKLQQSKQKRGPIWAYFRIMDGVRNPDFIGAVLHHRKNYGIIKEESWKKMRFCH